jgi:hypothetical protein
VNCTACVNFSSSIVRSRLQIYMNVVKVSSHAGLNGMQPGGVVRLFRMGYCRPAARCGNVISISRTSAPIARYRAAGSVARRNSDRAPRAVAEEATTAPHSSGELEGRVSKAYPFTEIEKKWQSYWDENATFRTPHKVDTSKPKYYVLDMFPYPRCTVLLRIPVQVTPLNHDVSCTACACRKPLYILC